MGKKFLTLQNILSAALLVAAVGFFALGNSRGGIVANAADQNYTTNWTATKVLRVNSPVGQTGIGVWGWRVDGTIGTTTYTETWTAPDVTGVSMTPAGLVGCDVTGIDRKSLLAGCASYSASASGNYTFQSVDVDSFLSQRNGPNSGSQGVQQSVACNGFSCVAQSGSYTFVRTQICAANGTSQSGLCSNGSEEGGLNRTVTAGGLTPLKWSVTGTITRPN